MATTVLEVLKAGADYLEKRGIEDSRRNMQLLLAHALACSRTELYMNFDRPLTEGELEPIREDLRRRGEGEPLQYLLGTVHFYGREFRCDKRTLIPRPETEELVEIVLKERFPKPTRLLDMGCGSGVLGLTLAAELGMRCRELVLADISEEALELARANAAKHQQSAEFVRGDLFENLGGEFDLVLANLPYVAEAERANVQRELTYEPSEALFSGEDGLEHLRRFIPEAYRNMTPGGLLALEIGYDQDDKVEQLLVSAGFQMVDICRDLGGIRRFPLARLGG